MPFKELSFVIEVTPHSLCQIFSMHLVEITVPKTTINKSPNKANREFIHLLRYNKNFLDITERITVTKNLHWSRDDVIKIIHQDF